MSPSLTLTLLCFLSPPLAGAGTLEDYGNLSGKTVLMNSAVTVPSDLVIPDLPNEQTAAIARIESELSTRGIAVVEDGEKFAQVVPLDSAGSVKTRAPIPEAGVPMIDPDTVPRFPEFDGPPVLRIAGMRDAIVSAGRQSEEPQPPVLRIPSSHLRL